MSQVLLALGGNQGDVRGTFRWVAEQLAARSDVEEVRLSRAYRTPPVGEHAGEEFLNAALVCRTSLAPESLLALCQEWERLQGRQRVLVWGPRPLDIDIIGYGQLVCTQEQLSIPHPAAWYRRFVLEPLCELTPGWLCPVRGKTLREFRDRIRERPLILDLRGTTAIPASWQAELLAMFGASQLQIWNQETPGNPAAESATWCLGNLFEQPKQAWESLPMHNRLSLHLWPQLELRNLQDMIHSALDEPLLFEPDVSSGG